MEQIRAVIHRYARAMDRRDWDLVRDSFHDDAFDDHGGYAGDAEGFIQFSIPRHEKIEMSMHFIGNIVLELVGDRAAAETYCIARQRYSAEAAPEVIALFGEGVGAAEPRGLPLHLTIWCRYLDEFSYRADAGWRISRRQVAYDSLSCEQGPESLPTSDRWTTGRRTDADASYSLFARLGVTV